MTWTGGLVVLPSLDRFTSQREHAALIARLVGAGASDAYPTLTCNYYSYFENVPLEADAELYPRDGSMVIAVPTNDGLTQVVVLRRRAAFDSMRHSTLKPSRS